MVTIDDDLIVEVHSWNWYTISHFDLFYFVGLGCWKWGRHKNEWPRVYSILKFHPFMCRWRSVRRCYTGEGFRIDVHIFKWVLVPWNHIAHSMAKQSNYQLFMFSSNAESYSFELLIMQRRQPTSTRRNGSFSFAGALNAKSKSSPLLSICLVLVVIIMIENQFPFLICDIYILSFAVD